jgi:hypothetical protein
MTFFFIGFFINKKNLFKNNQAILNIFKKKIVPSSNIYNSYFKKEK